MRQREKEYKQAHLLVQGDSGVLEEFIYLLAERRDEISVCHCWLLCGSSFVCVHEQQLTFIFGDAAVEGVLEQEEKRLILNHYFNSV